VIGLLIAAQTPLLALVGLLILAFSAVAYAADPLADVAGGLDALTATLSSVGTSIGAALHRRRGRPRKFAAPSRAITLTLPETVLETLTAIDPDPSRAIVQLAKKRTPVNGKAAAQLEVFGNRAVITIRPTTSLERRTGIDLVPLPDGRALMSFDQPRTIADLELMIYDALEEKDLPSEDRKVFEAIGGILTEARRSHDVNLLRRSIIVLESNGTGRAVASKPVRKTSR
jgi:hypothetical protein